MPPFQTCELANDPPLFQTVWNAGLSDKSCGCTRRSPAVNRHGNDDDRSDNDLLNVVWPTDLLAAVAQEGHDQCANQRAEDAAFTTTAQNYRPQ